MPAVKIAVGEIFRRSKLPAVKIAVTARPFHNAQILTNLTDG
jgi:hypothetical protein